MIRIMQTILIAPDTLELTDLMVQVTLLDLLVERMKAKNLDVPQELEDSLKTSQRELAYRTREDKERKLKLLKTRRESLLTADEKRAKLDADIAALQTELSTP